MLMSVKMYLCVSYMYICNIRIVFKESYKDSKFAKIFFRIIFYNKVIKTQNHFFTTTLESFEFSIAS
jgi:hypothetical protein